jgi:hypothetical protein
MLITRKSPLTGNLHEMEMDITPSQINAYLNEGLLLQDAFPHLNADEREFIKTGIPPQEWEELLA